MKSYEWLGKCQSTIATSCKKIRYPDCIVLLASQRVEILFREKVKKLGKLCIPHRRLKVPILSFSDIFLIVRFANSSQKSAESAYSKSAVYLKPNYLK